MWHELRSAGAPEERDASNLLSAAFQARLMALSQWWNSFFTGRLARLGVVSTCSHPSHGSVVDALDLVDYSDAHCRAGICSAAERCAVFDQDRQQSQYSFAIGLANNAHVAFCVCAHSLRRRRGSVVACIIIILSAAVLTLLFASPKVVIEVVRSLLTTPVLVWLLTTASFMLQAREFDGLRSHEQLQLGAGLETQVCLPTSPSSRSYYQYCKGREMKKSKWRCILKIPHLRLRLGPTA